MLEFFATMSKWQMMHGLLLFLSCFSMIGSQTTAEVLPTNAVDLLFMVDSSGYITRPNFNSVLRAVVSCIETLSLGLSDVQVAALSYSVALERSDFYWDINLLRQIVPRLYYDGQGAHTHIAFEEAYIVMQSRHILRPQARRIVLLITSSFALYPASSQDNANRLIESGVEIWAIGLGSQIRLLELYSYTRNLSRIFLWNRYDVLPPIDLGLAKTTAYTNSSTQIPLIQPASSTLYLTTAISDSFHTSSELYATTSVPINPSYSIGISLSPPSSTNSPTPQLYTSHSPVEFPDAVATPRTRLPLESVATFVDMPTSVIRLTEVPGFFSDVAGDGSISQRAISDTTAAVTTKYFLSTSTATSTPQLPTTPTSRSSIATGGFFISPTPSVTAQGTAISIHSSTYTFATANFSVSMASTASASADSTSRNAPSLLLSVPTQSYSAYTSLLPTSHPSSTSTDSLYTAYISVAPTSTQSGLPSTVRADDPRTNTTSGNSIQFDSLENDGLCYKAAVWKGFGFVPHPRDCDKFLQCYRSEAGGAVTASVRLCPPGQFWKQASLTCVDADQKCCQDQCERKCDGQTFSMDGGCSRYWECSKGVSIAKKCPLYHAYIPSKGCVFMSTCVDIDRRDDRCQSSGKCEAAPLSNKSGYKIHTLSGSFYFACWESMEFDLASCSCRPKMTQITCCPHVTLFNRTSNIVTNTSLINNARYLTGCTSAHKPHPAGNQHRPTTANCSYDRTPASDPMRSVTLYFRYVTSNDLRPNSLPQVLVRSSACVPEHGGILVVSEQNSFLDVKIMSSTGYVLKAFLPLWSLDKTIWWEVYVQYNRGDLFLQLKAGNIVYNVYSKGGPHIPIGACGWKVAEPEELSDFLSGFSGNMSDVLVSRCNEYGY